jgi:molybdopterin molybdotransferase
MSATAARAPLMEFDQAFEQLMAHAAPIVRTLEIDTLRATGRVLAQAIASQLDVPPLDNAQMDGYALACVDATSNAALPVSQRVPAGSMPSPLTPGTVARIFTGAPIPLGADAVVMQELVTVDADGAVRINEALKPGQWIRRRAEDIAKGQTVLEQGAVLSPQACGLVASVGQARVKVFDRVKVACFFTGDELVMPGQALPPGAIYNSNRFVLRGMLESIGCEVIDLGIVPDSLEATRQALRTASLEADLIITSGGMSVGEEDHIKAALQAEGSLNMWQMAMKPGKPLAYGTVRREGGAAHFIGLPGNPVSAFVTFLLLARPFIAKLQGRSAWQTPARTMRADFSWPKPDKRREFLRVRRNQSGGLDLFENQGSGVLTSTVWADGLVDNPAGRAIATGDQVRFIAFSDLLS